MESFRGEESSPFGQKEMRVHTPITAVYQEQKPRKFRWIPLGCLQAVDDLRVRIWRRHAPSLSLSREQTSYLFFLDLSKKKKG